MLRPQDIFVLLVLLEQSSKQWTFQSVAERIGMSKSQVYRSLRRAEKSHLFDHGSRRVRRPELLEFLSHGLRYAFAVVPGEPGRGVATSWSAPSLREEIVSNLEEEYVWPHPRGSERGLKIEPLHNRVAPVAMELPALHRLLALCDAIRLGGARERKVAVELLSEDLE